MIKIKNNKMLGLGITEIVKKSIKKKYNNIKKRSFRLKVKIRGYSKSFKNIIKRKKELLAKG